MVPYVSVKLREHLCILCGNVLSSKTDGDSAWMPFSGVDLAWVTAATIVGPGQQVVDSVQAIFKGFFANFHDTRVVNTSP